MIINEWARTRLLALSVYLDVKSKLSVKNRGILLLTGMVTAANGLPFIAMVLKTTEAHY